MPPASVELVLLPGLDGTGRLFQWLEQALLGRVATSVVSYPSDPALGYRELIALVESRMEIKPVVVLGESFSGPIAVELAARHPDQVKGLILAATFLRSPWPPWMLRAAARVSIDTVPPGVRNRFLRGPRADPELDAVINSILSDMPSGVRASRLREVAAVDVSKPFASLRCPVLALQGSRDFVVPRWSLKSAIHHKVNARMTEFVAGHMLLQTKTKETANEIAAFVQDIERDL